jgi:hypothetical protein
MPVADRYTVEHAARRMGLKVSRVRQLIKDGTLAVVSTNPVRVDAIKVEELRAVALEDFEDLVDVSTASSSPSDDWLRAVAASQELLDQGVEQIRRAGRMLVDGYVAGLPVPYDAPGRGSRTHPRAK